MTMSFGPSGAMVALLTPLDADGRLDEHGLERLVERVVAGGIDGISPNGSTGEGARLGRERRIAVATRVRKLAPDGMPVVSGVPLTTLDEGRAELDDLAELGATAALVAPPSYYPLPDESVLRMYEALAGDAPLPLLLYNIPIFTKVRLAPGVVARLATHPAIAGIKDSSRDMEYQQELIAATADAEFAVLTGADSLLVASLAAGVAGSITAGANLVPELPVGIQRAFHAGDFRTATELQRRLARIVAACNAGEPPAGWKAALSVAGVCGPDLAAPAAALPATLRATLEIRLAAEGIA
ncbi:MAG TPA: dihydrodipicolinate synthase family protein [Jatrophihabitantaceae bacterium]|nr:dihydrodipicolinate synthase family protein [Jatrophihabitantaceae bacterium]